MRVVDWNDAFLKLGEPYEIEKMTLKTKKQGAGLLMDETIKAFNQFENDSEVIRNDYHRSTVKVKARR